MAYSDLPWRPFLGHQAWSWTRPALRRGNVFYYVYKRFFNFCHVFTFLTFFKFLFERFFTSMTRGQYPHHLLPHLNRHRFYLSDIGLYRLSYRKAVAEFVRPGYTYRLHAWGVAYFSLRESTAWKFTRTTRGATKSSWTWRLSNKTSLSVIFAQLTEWLISLVTSADALVSQQQHFTDSASEVTTLWRYTNLFIIIIIYKYLNCYCPASSAITIFLAFTPVSYTHLTLPTKRIV